MGGLKACNTKQQAAKPVNEDLDVMKTRWRHYAVTAPATQQIILDDRESQSTWQC